MAVAHAIGVAICHMLSKQTASCDLGLDYFATCDRATEEGRLVKRLQRLGYDVTLQRPAS